MKRTMIFLPKFLYAAIFISAVFGLTVFGAGGNNNGLWIVDSGWWSTNKILWIVDSGWWIAGNRAESQKSSRIENDGASELRKIKNLSASIGSGGFDLSSYEVVSSSRDLWSDQSNAQSCVFGSFEYCGRAGQGNESRPQEFLDDSQRIVFRGIGNSRNSQETGIHTEGRLSIGSGGSLSASQTNQQLDQLSSVLDFLQSTIHNLLSIRVYAAGGDDGLAGAEAGLVLAPAEIPQNQNKTDSQKRSSDGAGVDVEFHDYFSAKKADNITAANILAEAKPFVNKGLSPMKTITNQATATLVQKAENTLRFAGVDTSQTRSFIGQNDNTFDDWLSTLAPQVYAGQGG